MAAVCFDPLSSLVRLGTDGSADVLERSAEGWRVINRATGERVVGMSRPEKAGDLHPDSWEMHPEGDELLHLFGGAIDLLLDEPEGEQRIRLKGGQSCVVTRGTWHCLLLREPSTLMFVTPAGGTRMRPRIAVETS